MSRSAPLAAPLAVAAAAVLCGLVALGALGAGGPRGRATTGESASTPAETPPAAISDRELGLEQDQRVRGGEPTAGRRQRQRPRAKNRRCPAPIPERRRASRTASPVCFPSPARTTSASTAT